MKKLLLTITILFLSFNVFSQNFQIDSSSKTNEKRTIEVTEAKKALLIIDYRSERLNLGSLSNSPVLAEVDLQLVEKFEILKGESAIAKFGKGAQNGVILLFLKKSKAAKAMFEDFKKRLDDELLIDTDKEMKVDKRTGFTIGKPDEFSIGNSQEPAKLSQLRPGNQESSVILIMSINGKERLIKNTLDLEKFATKYLKSIDILKDEESKARYNSKGKDVVIATFKSSKETKKYFRKLKKIKNK